ncbi:hypothetical protein OSH11_17220 [Kaistia dalseonensis]|uniref:Uncharacterized protein n=1 Tax=Kaistia dalseonensis TaxID=410840 RepID=A0ABU0H9S3_9HYPH|nr:hypothetical protein [Kaistia dalseonensis]MCX5496451.1 hypothetical protein [Kaistia dalseonensis]MDQ0439072.1 hypothetical protein [Kaistia dalseonensis]
MSTGTITVKGRSIVVTERSLGRRAPVVPHDQRREMAQKVDDIEARLNRLTVSRHDPERFFVQRSELADDLRRLAVSLRE